MPCKLHIIIISLVYFTVTNICFCDTIKSDKKLLFSNNHGAKLSAAEINVLLKLKERSKYLDKIEKKLQNREKILHAIEKIIDDKIKKLEDLQNKCNKSLKSIKAEEKEKIRGFVKIYENMPPKNAAEILNQMDTELAVKIISSMKEIKASSILACMHINKSKEISIILGSQTFGHDYEE